MKDVIEKSVLIRASREAVWQALIDHGAFGDWFRARVAGPFEVGRRVELTSTYEGHEGVTFWLVPVAIDAPQSFVFDWPAGESDTTAPGDDAQTTRVAFRLAAEGETTRVTVIESGFAALPEAVAARKYPENTDGWEKQVENLRAHVEA